MIVPCPAFQTRFNVEVDALSKIGRKVRCAKCGQIWHQTPFNKVNSPSLQSAEDEEFKEKGEINDAEKRGTVNLQKSEINVTSQTNF